MKMINRVCEVCKKTFQIREILLKENRGRGRFCSRECMGIARNGEGHHLWKGIKRIIKSGYVVLGTVANHTIFEHRAVVEKQIGRPLESGEVVHHIDGDKTNNSPENLVVMSASEHIKHHRKNSPRLTQWAKKYSACTMCGSVDIPHAANGLCDRCYAWNKNH